MRHVYRIVTTAIAVAAVFPFALPAAHADASAALLLDSNWFWHDQFDGQVGPTGVGQRMPGKASGTQDGMIGIGYTNGKSATASLTPDAPKDYPEDTPNKETYLRWKIFGEINPEAATEPTLTIPAGSLVSTFTFTLPLDTKASTPQPQTPVKLVACLPKNDWSAGNPPYGDPFSGKPEDDCSVFAEGVWDAATSSYSFAATAIAQAWVTSGLNLGVGIRQKPGEKQAFQFNADPKQVKAAIDFTPPDAPPTVTPPTTPVTPPDPGSVAPPPVFAGGSGAVPFVPQPQPQAQPQAPVVGQPATPTVPQAAATPFKPDLGPDASLWLAMLVGVVVLGATSLVLGNQTPVPVTSNSRTPLDRALRAKQEQGGSASSLRPRHV